MIYGFKNSDQRGAILVFSLLILSVVMSISFAVLGIFLPKIKIASDPLKSVTAFYAADSATEWCLHMNTNYSKPTPILAYSFYEGAGNVVASSYVADAQYNGIRSEAGATWATGIQNNAMNFDGSSGRVIVPQSGGDATDLASSFTLSAWVYPTNVDDYRTIIYRASDPGMGWDGYYYWLMLTTGGAVSSGFKGLPGWVREEHICGSVPVDTWSYIAGVFDNSANNFKIYVNGALACNEAETLTPDGNVDEEVTMGFHYCYPTATCPSCCSSNPYERFMGSIDEVRIYKDKALTQAQILEDMNSALPIPSVTPTPTPLPPSPPVMSNGSTYSIYSPASGITPSDCIEGTFNHRIVGTYSDVARSLEIFE